MNESEVILKKTIIAGKIQRDFATEQTSILLFNAFCNGVKHDYLVFSIAANDALHEAETLFTLLYWLQKYLPS